MRRAPALLLLLAAAACEDADDVLDRRMAEQPRYDPYEASDLFANGRVMQDPVPGTVARGDLDYVEELFRRPEMTPELLLRGRERYDVYCSPCHGRAGTGDGIVARRVAAPPPSFHGEALRPLPPEYVVQVITDGKGLMYSYANRVRPADRWAIAAYVQALQLARRAEADALPADVRARLPPDREGGG